MPLEQACRLALTINRALWPRYVVRAIERGPSLTEERYSLLVWRASDATQMRVESVEDAPEEIAEIREIAEIAEGD